MNEINLMLVLWVIWVLFFFVFIQLIIFNKKSDNLEKKFNNKLNALERKIKYWKIKKDI